jgi:hypothetical protein
MMAGAGMDVTVAGMVARFRLTIAARSGIDDYA